MNMLGLELTDEFTGILIAVFLLLIYGTAIYFLRILGLFEKYNLSLMGPALMWRTKRGIYSLKKIAKKQRFWRSFGSIGIILCLIVMVIMVSLIVWQTWTILEFTPEQRQMLPGPEFILVIPGINPILPLEFLLYIIIGLIIAMIVHEFSHGIMTLAHEMKLKSLGLLYLIVPIGAFAEPDEDEIKNAPPPPRMRIYAAGPTANFIVTVLSIILLSFLFMAAVQPVSSDGILVSDIHDDSPAEQIGLQPGIIISSINNTPLTNLTVFVETMLSTKANTTVSLIYLEDGTTYQAEVKLADRYDEYKKRGITTNESFKGIGYLGISILNRGELDLFLSALQNPFQGGTPHSFLLIYIIPLWGYFQGFNPLVSPFTDFFTITGPLAILPASVFWFLVNTLYWVFWLNLAVAIFNVLPIIPLDGGFLFTDSLDLLVRRFKGEVSKEQRERTVRKITYTISIILLALVLFPFFLRFL